MPLTKHAYRCDVEDVSYCSGHLRGFVGTHFIVSFVRVRGLRINAFIVANILERL